MKGTSMPFSEGQFAMKNGVSDTLFGLIGRTTRNMATPSLGGLISHSASGPVPSGLEKGMIKTEKSIMGKNATKTPGAHAGQVPYAGKFMTKVGPKL